MSILTTLTILCVSLFHGVTQTFGDDKVQLLVFYESKCPDCMDFISIQLYKTWKELKSHIKLGLVPYGKAQQQYKDGHWHFQCQHGPKECVGNIQQACALYHACDGRKTTECPVDKLAKAMDYINCVMQPLKQAPSDQCASQAGLQSSLINRCANGALGEMLMSFFGNYTEGWSRSPEFHSVGVPFIIINNNYSKEINAEARQDLRSVICKYIPHQC